MSVAVIAECEYDDFNLLFMLYFVVFTLFLQVLFKQHTLWI